MAHEILHGHDIADERVKRPEVLLTSSQNSSAMLKDSTDSALMENTSAANDGVISLGG